MIILDFDAVFRRTSVGGVVCNVPPVIRAMVEKRTKKYTRYNIYIYITGCAYVGGVSYLRGVCFLPCQTVAGRSSQLLAPVSGLVSDADIAKNKLAWDQGAGWAMPAAT